MKLSIFPSVLHLPKSKEEKHQQSKKASQCEVVTVLNDDDLVRLVTTHAWSPFVFHDNKRLASNFLSTEFLVYDIDEGMTIEQCEAIITREKLCCLCLPSTSHTPEHHKFRIILPLGSSIRSPQVYADTWDKGAELFGFVDGQTKDLARFFFGCRDDDGFWLDGDLFMPVVKETVRNVNNTPSHTKMIEVTEDIDKLIQDIYGEKRSKIPEAVAYFVKNAHTGLKNEWTNRLNQFVFSLTLSGVDETMTWDVCEELAPAKLDSRDRYQIKRAIRDAKASL